MHRLEVQDRVLDLLGTVLQTSVDPTTSTNTLPAWDSLRHIQVIFAVEDAFNVQFPEEALGELTSVELLVDALMDEF